MPDVVTDEGVTLACTLKLGLRGLRQALASVVPHAEPTKTGDDPGPLSRVRLVAAKGELHVLACSADTAAMAAVDIDEDSRDEHFARPDGPLVVDLAPGSVRKILQVFKVGRVTADGEDAWCQLDIDARPGGFIEVTDVDALLPGASFRVPTEGLRDDFPDVVSAISRAAANAQGDAKPLVAQGKPLAVFLHARTAYGEPLQFRPTGSAESRGFLVVCGARFVGTISSRHNDDDSLKRRDAEWRQHLERLGLKAPLASVG
jgi:hypothetical protein